MHLVMSLVLLSEAYLYLEQYAFAAKSRASVGKTREAEKAEPASVGLVIGCELQGQNWDYIYDYIRSRLLASILSKETQLIPDAASRSRTLKSKGRKYRSHGFS